MPVVIVIDTQSFAWMTLSPKRLSMSAKGAIENATNIFLPSIVIWETAMLLHRRRVTVKGPPLQWLAECVSQQKMRICELTAAIAMASVALDMHGDPSDRLIVATAQALRKIIDSGLVETVW